ncbi:MAG: 3-deoxy-8-phosphooctulonate synthase [Deltaproteobacteria bacterium]|nr:3-deoxy-8-phosphooctulonate synthase [Deltaproteobacteria bacterium]
MRVEPVAVDHPDGSAILVGTGHPLLIIAGPCVLESEELARTVAAHMQKVCSKFNVSYIFKASFDKANRTSVTSYRGPGLEKGLRVMEKIRAEMKVPVLSDIHEPQQAEAAAEILDILQIPAFLCRQTDLLVAASLTGKPINLKKGQFVSPWDLENAVNKIRQGGSSQVMLVERGASFGYNNLVVDMRSLPVMRSFNCPVIYDATHSVQLPGGSGATSSGQREFIAPLARAAAATGIDGLFLEVHPTPEEALCDGPNSIALSEIEMVLDQIVRIHDYVAP